ELAAEPDAREIAEVPVADRLAPRLLLRRVELRELVAQTDAELAHRLAGLDGAGIRAGPRPLVLGEPRGQRRAADILVDARVPRADQIPGLLPPAGQARDRPLLRQGRDRGGIIAPRRQQHLDGERTGCPPQLLGARLRLEPQARGAGAPTSRLCLL